MAVLAFGLAGAGLTSAIGIGASIGWMGGVVLGNLLLGGKGSNTEGSRLSDLSVQTSTYGGTIQLVYGTMRVSGNVIWSTPLKEARHVSRAGGKGGGAKSTSYTYSVSFAVGLCAGPVATVRKIWADTKLIYDATARNTQATEKYPGVVRIHTGAEDQQPDSTMEMHLGTDNVPGYRGLCYLTFADLQLADFANRIPNISAEVVSSGGMACDAVILPKVSGMYYSGGIIDPARGTLVAVTASRICKYDLVGNRLLLNIPLDASVYGDLMGYDSEGYIYHATDAYAVSMNLVKRHPDTLAVVAKTKTRIKYSTSGFVQGNKIYVHNSRKIYDLEFNEIVDLSEWFPLIGGHDFPMCSDTDNRYWQAASDKIRCVTLNALQEGQLAEWDITAWTEGQRPDIIFWDETTGHLYFKINVCKRIVKWHPDKGYAGHVDKVAFSAGFTLQSDYTFPQKGRLWCIGSTNACLVDLVNMRIEKEIDLFSYIPTYATHSAGCYEKFTHSAVIMTGAGEIKYPLERYGSNQISVASILSDLCQKAGLKQTDILTDEVSQSVHGYVVSRRVTARDALEPLLGAYFIDAAETDGVLRFIPRGQDMIVTIPYDDLGAVEGSSNESPLRIAETRTQELELPQRIDLTHYDPDRDYQSNTQNAARNSNAITTRELKTIELPIVLPADEAAQIADKTLTSAWIGRNQFEFNLPPKWLRLDPTDVIDVLLQDATLSLRLTQVDFGGNNIVACKAVAEDEVAYTSKAKGTSAPITTGAISISTPILALVMDLPMLRAEDDGLGLYYALALKDNSAAIYKSPDALTWSIIGTGSVAPVCGWASSALADSLSPWVWDEANTVQVTLSQGTLDSKTALEVLNWANIALLGDELIQWRNATLLAENLYQLSGLLRGRRGTEWATSLHKIGERFVVLATDGFYRTAMASTEIGQTSYYKAVPSNGDWDDAAQIYLKFNAASLRCFSPVHIAGSRDVSGNLTISWVRRTRWNGEWLDGIDIPLFEDEEGYQVDVLNGDTVMRTISANTASAAYSAADQIADFGSAQSVLAISIYQINSIVGRGYPRKAMV